MTQSVEDGATVPISYESCIVEIQLDETILDLIDDNCVNKLKNIILNVVNVN